MGSERKGGRAEDSEGTGESLRLRLRGGTRREGGPEVGGREAQPRPEPLGGKEQKPGLIDTKRREHRSW
eukprot:76757-Rhodomonas_salina.2